MKKASVAVGVLVLAMSLAMAAPAGKAGSSSGDMWLHVRVQDGAGERAETVHVNVPLTLAEAVIPAIQVDSLHNGKVKIESGHTEINGIDFRKILDAVRQAKDGNYVTVEGSGDNVRVAKEGGYLLAKVREAGEKGSRVDVKVPMAVVEALFTGEKDELNLSAAIHALGVHGDGVLVTVDDKNSKVRIWVDSQNESE